MSVKMIASRRHYLKAEGRELESGTEFTVESDREADRLVRMRRATRVDTEQAPPPKARHAKPQQPELSAGFLSTASMKAEDGNAESDAATAPRRYRRRDLAAED